MSYIYPIKVTLEIFNQDEFWEEKITFPVFNKKEIQTKITYYEKLYALKKKKHRFFIVADSKANILIPTIKDDL